MVKSLADLVREYDRGDDVEEQVRAAMLRAGITHCFAASYDRNDLYFNMQQLEYWEDRPRYTGLPEPDAPEQLEGQKQITGEVQ